MTRTLLVGPVCHDSDRLDPAGADWYVPYLDSARLDPDRGWRAFPRWSPTRRRSRDRAASAREALLRQVGARQVDDMGLFYAIADVVRAAKDAGAPSRGRATVTDRGRATALPGRGGVSASPAVGRPISALVTDELWAEVRPLLPAARRSPGGRAPRAADDRACLEGILCVLRSGIAWNRLPAGAYPSYAACWRRLRDWTAAGVWDRVCQTLLQRLGDAAAIDWSRAVIVSARTRAARGVRTAGA